MSHLTERLEQEESLLQLGRLLQERGYRFTTTTPATHERVNARPENAWATSVEDVLGWSRPFRDAALPSRLFSLMQAAGVLRQHSDGWRSAIRVSTLEDTLFFHSAHPTSERDAVFFGPDTYRFGTAIQSYLATGRPVGRAVDVGCGAGPGAVLIGKARPQAQVMAVDINEQALRYTRINAALAATENVIARRSDLLSQVDGDFDLIVANPPYLLDQDERVYRHGGGGLGEGLSVAIAAAAATRLAPGGTLLLYTGSVICGGVDRLRELVTARLNAGGLEISYSELDPDVFGEELLEPAYMEADRIAAVLVTARRPG